MTSVNAAARAAVLAINGTGATGQDGIEECVCGNTRGISTAA